jgi:hypothetical protein
MSESNGAHDPQTDRPFAKVVDIKKKLEFARIHLIYCACAWADNRSAVMDRTLRQSVEFYRVVLKESEKGR